MLASVVTAASTASAGGSPSYSSRITSWTSCSSSCRPCSNFTASAAAIRSRSSLTWADIYGMCVFETAGRDYAYQRRRDGFSAAAEDADEGRKVRRGTSFGWKEGHDEETRLLLRPARVARVPSPRRPEVQRVQVLLEGQTRPAEWGCRPPGLHSRRQIAASNALSVLRQPPKGRRRS